MDTYNLFITNSFFSVDAEQRKEYLMKMLNIQKIEITGINDTLYLWKIYDLDINKLKDENIIEEFIILFELCPTNMRMQIKNKTKTFKLAIDTEIKEEKILKCIIYCKFHNIICNKLIEVKRSYTFKIPINRNKL